MEAYIDLSIIFFTFNFILSFIYSMIIFDDIKYNAIYIIQTILISIVSLILNLFLIPYFFIFFLIIYSLFMSLFSIKYLKVLLVSGLIFYCNNALMLLVGGCYFYDGIILISTPFVTLFILIIPIYITIIHLIHKSIYNYFKDKKFKIKCKLFIDNKVIKGYGYFDTGNALIYQDIPVVFSKGKAFNNNGEIIHINGINSTNFTYLAYKAKLSIKDKLINVYVVFIGEKHNFFNCSFLLNKYVL